MNKYLKWFINLIIQLAIVFVGVLFAMNMMLAGLLFFPDVTTRVAPLMDANPVWLAAFFPGLIPSFVLLSILGLAIFSFVITIKLANKFDIERIITAIQKGLKGDREKAKSE